MAANITINLTPDQQIDCLNKLSNQELLKLLDKNDQAYKHYGITMDICEFFLGKLDKFLDTESIEDETIPERVKKYMIARKLTKQDVDALSNLSKLF